MYTQKPLHGQDQGELQNLRGEHKNKFVEDKTENLTQRSVPTNTSQPRSCLHAHCSNWGLDAEVQGSDPKERTEVDCHEDTLRWLV